MSRTINTADNQAEPYAPPFIVAESIDNLHGPLSKEVILPTMMRIILREARTQDDLTIYLNRENMLRLW